MTPQEYVPMFDDQVYEYLQFDEQHRGAYPISKYYCLLPASARILSSFFSVVPEIYMAPPNPQAPGSPFAFTKFVPWFRWTKDGVVTERNAGQLAIYWGMPGVPDGLQEAEIDVAMGPIG